VVPSLAKSYSHPVTKGKLIFFQIVFMYGLSAGAHVPSEGDIHVTAGPYFHATHARDHDIHSPWLGGFGAIVEGNIDKNGGFEISAFYLNQFFSMNQDGLLVNEVGQRMYITMGYRHWFHARWSAAAAFFSSYLMGDPKPVHRDPGGPTVPVTSAKDTTEYGFDFSVQYEAARWNRFAAVIDLRYSLSVTQKPAEDANFYGFIVGVKYLAQDKDKPGERKKPKD